MNLKHNYLKMPFTEYQVQAIGAKAKRLKILSGD
jgi:hypothetical protein